ncbi:MAG TPA: CcmD family protein [Puia sp.]
MHKKIYMLVLALLGGLVSVPAMAQGKPADTVDMADKFRADGKIYVVVLVVVVILAGLFFYVARLDRKISKFEKDLK